MIKLQEVKDGEARVRELVKKIKPIDTIKVELPGRKLKRKTNLKHEN
jgi:hypothetical protein